MKIIVTDFRIGVIAWLACVGLVFAEPDVVSAADPALVQAINKSGRQRMLTQRIIKAYAQLGQGIAPEIARRQLDEAVRLFDVQLAELRQFTSDAHLRQSVSRLEKLWRPFKAVATATADRSGAERLLAMEDELVAAAHQLTVELQDRSGSAVGRLVNLAGRQRMLSQRLAKYYLLRAWGIESPAIGREIGSARAEFDGALAALRSAPENTEEIRKELEAVAMQWEWFRNALELGGATSYGLIVIHASEGILHSMEVVTGLYERLAVR